MGNISYFCIVKRFKSLLRYSAPFIFLLLTYCNRTYAQQDSILLQKMDSVEISLLTCQPRQNVYSLYGHTAIRIQNHCSDAGLGADIAVNYGMFSFRKPYFVLRFVFGLTDYEMGIETFDEFRPEYERVGCGVLQQKLNLNREEKLSLLQAIDVNFLPENRVYRYNFFYDNCTTRARDIIIRCIKGVVKYPSDNKKASFREMIHDYNADHPWARFGNDLLLGVKADLATTQAQQQFLPRNLSNDFADAVIESNDGTKRRLVTSTTWALQPGTQDVEKEFPLSPTNCAAILSTIIILASVADWKRRKLSVWLDAILLAADGLAGVILFAMLFSQHPTVSLNLQILLLNPLNIAFFYHTIRDLRKGRANRWLTIWLICICLFFAGAILQHYADGMLIVASSLLIRILFIRKITNAQTAARHDKQ